METVYDWVTVVIFAGLVVLFLQRSTLDDPGDTIFPYLAAAVGCAVSNYLGNSGRHLIGVLAIATTVVYIFYALKPLRRRGGRG